MATSRRGRIFLRDRVDVSALVSVPGDDPRRPQAADLTGVLIEGADEKDLDAIADAIHEGARSARRGEGAEALDRSKRAFQVLPPALLGPLLRLVRHLSYEWNLDLSRWGVPRDPFGSAIVTSVGMLGIQEAYGPLPPFAGASLLVAVGAVEDRVVVHDGEIAIRKRMRVTATFDHRFVDAYQGAKLGRAFRERMERPGVPRDVRRAA